MIIIETKDPCREKSCQYGAVCVVSFDRKEAQCQCPTNCDDKFGDSVNNEPVCGSDNKDYKNECSLKEWSCTNFLNTTVAKRGKCST